MADLSCPKCKGDLLFETVNKKVRIDDETFALPCWCKRCGFQYKVWFDVKFSGYEDLDGNVVDDYCQKGKGCKHLDKKTCCNAGNSACFEEKK
jgi:uncharacterized protein YbaR (Trm112 family)